jgi:Tfp pilus assembly protein PilN
LKSLALSFYSKPSISTTGAILLLVCSVFAGAGFYKQSQLVKASEAVSLKIAQLTQEIHPNKQLSQHKNQMHLEQAHLKDINKTANLLMFSWMPLLSALESAQSEHVALLSIEPDQNKHKLTISAEAKDRTAMFAYVKLLQNDTRISNVYIKRHDVQTSAEGQPIRFEIEAEMPL